nr:DMT family transporter [Roseibium sp. CAU 1639]
MRGVALIIAAALTISLQDVVFKIFSSELSLWQIFALRGILAIPLLMVVLWMRGAHRGVVHMALQKWPLLRAVFITTTFLAFYAAIPFLSLSTVGAANYIAPIFVALLSAYAIREPVGLLGWLGVLLGFAGVVVLLRPGTDAFSLWSILPIIGAAFYALAHITTRVKCQDTPLPAISLAQNIVMMSAGVLVSILLIWAPSDAEFVRDYPYIFGIWSDVALMDGLILVILAGFTILISVLLAAAYQAAPPAIISTFEYSYLVFVAIWDTLFFGITPTFTSVTGMALIVIAGLLVLRRGKAKAAKFRR